MSKKKHKIIINNQQQNNIIATDEIKVDGAEEIEVIDDQKEQQPIATNTEPFMHMYRVRLDWERPDTQIFASPDYNDALEEAKAHEGYKIYIDDDGKLEFDPWEKKKEEKKEKPDHIIFALPGHPIELDETPVYISVFARKPYKTLTGKYYFYDSVVNNGRAKITDKKVLKNRDPKYIIGYIDI